MAKLKMDDTSIPISTLQVSDRMLRKLRNTRAAITSMKNEVIFDQYPSEILRTLADVEKKFIDVETAIIAESEKRRIEGENS